MENSMQNLEFTLVNAREVAEITAYMGRIIVSYADLIAAFGPPQPCGDYKTAVEWWLRFSDGAVASIYDYKKAVKYQFDGLAVEDIDEWHIGGRSTAVVARILAILGDKATLLPDG
jgi:hypothetical protein